MKSALLKFVSPFFIVMLTAVGGNAVAAGGTDQSVVSQAPQPPVDCKKTPEDPRCKDKK